MISANVNNIFGLFITHSFTTFIQRPSSRSKRQAIEVEKTEHEGLSGEPGEAEQEGSGEPEVAKKGGGVSLGKILGNFKVLYPKYRGSPVSAVSIITVPGKGRKSQF